MEHKYQTLNQVCLAPDQWQSTVSRNGQRSVYLLFFYLSNISHNISDTGRNKKNCETLKTENINLKQNVNQLDNYSCRNNLVIEGIEEKDYEQCEKLECTFFKNKLKVDSNSVNQMRIIGCHRLGKQFGHKGRPQSIIVRFLDYNDQHIVWIAKKNINEHFCGDTEF